MFCFAWFFRHPRPSLALQRLGAIVGLTLLAACGGGSGGDGGVADANSAAEAAAAAAKAAKVAVGLASDLPASAPIAATQRLTLRASAGLVADIGALFLIRHNGQEVARGEVRANSATDHHFELAVPIDAGQLELVFINAAGTEGFALRYLKVETLTVGNVVLLPTATGATFDRGDGASAFDEQDVLPGRRVLLSNGALRFVWPTPPANVADAARAAPGLYVDADLGDDGNPGSLARPWRSLARLASARLQSGDGIYLRCGRVWRESLVLSATQLVDGAVIKGYGAECTSQKATLSGADDFSGGWRQVGKLWSRSLPSGTPKITQLFIDGQALHTAQWPDATAAGRKSALSALSAPSNTSGPQLVLRDADNTALLGKDLAGATLQLRSQPWLIETRRITRFANGRLDFDRALNWAIDAGEGFVLQDKAWMLDSPAEFFHDIATQQLHLLLPSTGAPADLNSARVEGSVRDVSLSLSQRSGLVVRDLALRAAREDGLRLTDAPGAQLSHLVAGDNAAAGVRLWQWLALTADVAGPTVSDSLLAHNGQYGIDALHVERAVISRNQVLATGTAAAHQGPVAAAIAVGPGARVEDNTVDGSGYLGIHFSSQAGSVVARNTVMGYCTRLSDCAAIYSWAGRAFADAAQSAKVEGNRILAAVAQLEGTVSNGSDVVAGVYLDDFTRGVSVRNNLIAGAPVGVFLHNASDNTVQNNRIWLPGLVALWASMDQTDADWLTGNVLRDNHIVPAVQAQAAAAGLPRFQTSQAVWFWHSLAGEAALAPGRNTFSNNRVQQLQGALAQHAWLRGPAGERFVDAGQWQALAPLEAAVQRPARFAPLNVTLGPEQVADGAFDAGLASWRTYQNPAGAGFAAAAVASKAGCAGPCASLTTGHRGDLLASAPFTLRAGVPHVLRFSAWMPGQIGATLAAPYISRETTPWDGMADARGYAGYGALRAAAGEGLETEAFFVPKESTPSRINLQLETAGVGVVFDSVSVREVTGYSSASLADWSALALASRNSPRRVGCTELGWPSTCTAIDLDGQPVALPMWLAPGSEQLLLRADSPFRR